MVEGSRGRARRVRLPLRAFLFHANGAFAGVFAPRALGPAASWGVLPTSTDLGRRACRRGFLAVY